MKKVFLLFSAALFLLAVQSRANVSLVTSIPGGTVLTMPPVSNTFGPGPQTFGDVTWTSTNASTQGGSVFGYTGSYGFLGNGLWTGALGPMAGLNDSSDAMTFTLASPVSAIGGFLNYVPGDSTPTTIAVYDIGGNLLDSTTLTFTTNGDLNQGEFLGFQSDTANITSFTLSDNYVGITDLTGVGLTPEPSFYVALTIGIGLLLAMVHRRRTRANLS